MFDCLLAPQFKVGKAETEYGRVIDLALTGGNSRRRDKCEVRNFVRVEYRGNHQLPTEHGDAFRSSLKPTLRRLCIFNSSSLKSGQHYLSADCFKPVFGQ